MDNEKIKSYFNEQAEFWDETVQVYRQKRTQIVRMLQIQKGHKVLDIACGTGVLFEEMLAYMPRCIVGVDISEEMIKKAQSNHTDERIRLVADNFLTCDLSGFDRAVLFNAYPHFKEKASLARKISETLKTGGRFVFAHHHSRANINRIHKQNKAVDISVALKPAQIEQRWFEPYFKMDVCVDNDDMFVVSGVKTESANKRTTNSAF